MSKPNLHKRMYAVSLEGVGIVAGTMAYSRRSAIQIFTPYGNWEAYKRDGYRTVMARVQVIRRRGGAHSSTHHVTPPGLSPDPDILAEGYSHSEDGS